jgi:uncharacterized protein (DUF697 family)
MTSTSLVLGDPLALHRPLVIGRALAATVVGLVPIPLLDDWLIAAVMRRTVKRMAEARHVDLSTAALHALADGEVGLPSWKALVGAAIIPRLLARAWRSALWMFTVYGRANFAGRSFAVLTLCDHYFARVHVGGELDDTQAKKVRKAIDRAVASKEGSAVQHLVKRAVVGTGRAVVRAPFELVDALVGGLLSRKKQGATEAEAEEIVEETLRQKEQAPGSFLARVSAAVELQLATFGKDYVAGLVGVFERELRSAK